MPNLFDSARFGDLDLANRIILAPMTRSRADARGVINASAREYYGLRASAGLLITEGVNVSPMSNAFDRTPGLWTDEQVKGWKPVVDRVHQEGGQIVAQLWHGGRASSRGILGDREPLSPIGRKRRSRSATCLGASLEWGICAHRRDPFPCHDNPGNRKCGC